MKRTLIAFLVIMISFIVNGCASPKVSIQEAYLMRQPSTNATLIRIRIMYSSEFSFTGEGIKYKANPSQTAILQDNKGNEYKSIKVETVGTIGLDGEFMANYAMPRWSEGIIHFPLIDKDVKHAKLIIPNITGVSVYGQNIPPFSVYYDWDFSSTTIPETTWVLYDNFSLNLARD